MSYIYGRLPNIERTRDTGYLRLHPSGARYAGHIDIAVVNMTVDPTVVFPAGRYDIEVCLGVNLPAYSLVFTARGYHASTIIPAIGGDDTLPTLAVQGPPGPPGPQGPAGPDSPLMSSGPGRPDMPDTLDTDGQYWTDSATPGAIWCSTDGARTGAWQWQRYPTGWRVTSGDTGVINVTRNPKFADALTSPDGTMQPEPGIPVTARRIGTLVIINATLRHTKNTSSITTTGLPVGWQPRIAFSTPALTASSRDVCRVFINGNGNRNSMTGDAVNRLEMHAVYDTDDPWPTQL